MKCKTSQFDQFIAKPEINFWIPIIFTAVSITMSFMVLSTKVELNNQKLDQVIANQEQLLDRYDNIANRINTAERDITLLSTNQQIVLKNLGIK